jgi:hypothetical protein
MDHNEFDQLAQQLYAEMVPYGMQHDPYIRYRADLVVQAAHRGWAGAMARQPQGEEAYMRGVQDARAEAQKQASQSYQRGFNSALASMDRNMAEAYDRGFKEGQKALQQPKDSREDIVAEAMEQCRVIAESNPSMADGAKACKRMIKKLMK